MLNLCYDNNHNTVTWNGYEVNNNIAYQTFMEHNVGNRLNDAHGQQIIANHLRGLVLTGFESDNLSLLLNATPQEERDWAVGESFAEAILEQNYNVIFPWNNNRDLRNENASLPGADIVGLIEDNGQFKLLFGEVKTSVQNNFPPSVMYGRSGMTHQLETIGTNLTRLITLITWLFHRCKDTEFEPIFDEAFKYLIHNANKGLYLVGILVRPNITSNQEDLSGRGEHLGNIFDGTETKGLLLAYYLPHSAEDFKNLAIGGNQ